MRVRVVVVAPVLFFLRVDHFHHDRDGSHAVVGMTTCLVDEWLDERIAKRNNNVD